MGLAKYKIVGQKIRNKRTVLEVYNTETDIYYWYYAPEKYDFFIPKGIDEIPESFERTVNPSTRIPVNISELIQKQLNVVNHFYKVVPGWAILIFYLMLFIFLLMVAS